VRSTALRALKHVVHGSVEETLNALLEAEADRLVGAGRYERTEARQDTRAGSYDRKLHTTAGEVTLKVPKLRQGLRPLRRSVRDGDHRAVSAPGELGQGLDRTVMPVASRKPVERDRDVSGRCFGAPCRGHHRGTVGHAGLARDGLEPQQEDLRPDRDLAEPADLGETPLALPGWHRLEAQLGR